MQMDTRALTLADLSVKTRISCLKYVRSHNRDRSNTTAKGSSMSLKQSIENHPVVLYVGALLIGFVSGLATYEGSLRLTKQVVISPTDATKLSKFDDNVRDHSALTKQISDKDLALQSLKAEKDGLQTQLAAEQQKAAIARTQTSSKGSTATLQPSRPTVQVQLVSVTLKQGLGGCKDSLPVRVTEVFRLLGDATPSAFFMLDGFSPSALQPRKIDNEVGIVKADSSLPGWIVEYCAASGWKGEVYRQFQNPTTGAISNLLKIRLETT
jgi:hypothetical protein